MRTLPLLVLALLAGMAFSGCLGGDKAPTATDDEQLAEEAVATDETGSVKGQIVTNDLEAIAGTSVGLSQGGKILSTTETDKQGMYTMNGVAPGSYRVQVSSVCCQVGVKEITVSAGEVAEANFQLARLTRDDLRVPFMVEDEWNGFISCGVGLGVGSLAACALFEDTEVEDPNEDFFHEFNFTKGVQDSVFVLNWKAAGGISGTEFWFLVENDGCGATSCSYTYVDLTGPAPLRADVHDKDITDSAWKWLSIEDQRDMQFRIFASPATPGLVYQQPFTAYYTAFHYQDAPADYDPLPDA